MTIHPSPQRLALQLLESLLEACSCMGLGYVWIDWSNDATNSFFIEKVEALQILGLVQIVGEQFNLTPVGLKVARYCMSLKKAELQLDPRDCPPYNLFAREHEDEG